MLKSEVILKDIEGFEAQLDEVNKAINANLRDVAEFVRDDAKNSSLFNDKDGALRKSIRLKKSKFEGGGYIVYAGKNAGYQPHAHLVEFGHVAIPPGDLPGGRVPPRPFLRRAVENGIVEAVNIFRSAK